MGRNRWGFIYLLYHCPAAPDPTVSGNSTITPSGPSPGSNGALVSWGICGRRAAGILFGSPPCSRWEDLDSQRQQAGQWGRHWRTLSGRDQNITLANGDTENPRKGMGKNTMPGGTSMAVQWLRLFASNVGGTGWIPGWGTKTPPPQKKNTMLGKCRGSRSPLYLSGRGRRYLGA